MNADLEKYPKVLNAYMTYHGCSILLLGVMAYAPKKWLSKFIACLVLYGFKLNVLFGQGRSPMGYSLIIPHKKWLWEE